MFRVGQKVVCVNKDPEHPLVVGRIYTITGCYNTCKCGELVTVGIIGSTRVGGISQCPTCDTISVDPTDEWRFLASRFRAIVEDLTADLARKENDRLVEERPEHINEPEYA